MDEELRGMLATIVKEIHDVKDNMQELNRRVTALELTLENETNKNIMVVAEGHIDLSRKLDEAIKLSNSINSKMEMQQLYINKHESDINKIIQRIAKGIA